MSDPMISILSETTCRLGEGPFYCERRDTLYWFDIVNRRRYAHDFKTGTETSQAFPEMASAMAVIDDEHDLIFTESGLWSRELATGCWTPICSIEGDYDRTRSNDARVHRSGAFWLGTMSKTKEKGAGAIYHFRAGRLTMLYGDITIPNAICFSPDGATAYFTDTMTRKIMRVAINPNDGLPTGELEVFFAQADDDAGGVDGAICDGSGDVWNARWGSSCLDRYTSDGQRQHSIVLPVTQPSCPAFIGGNRIAVTSAWDDMDEAARAADPNAGKTILVELKRPLQARFEPKVTI